MVDSEKQNEEKEQDKEFKAFNHDGGPKSSEEVLESEKKQLKPKEKVI